MSGPSANRQRRAAAVLTKVLEQGAAEGMPPSAWPVAPPGEGLGGEPPTLAEYLEAVATGERLAVHYRDRGRVHGALLAGATWAQIADATAATTEALARRDYREWAAGEHNTWVKSGHQSGLDEAE